MRWSVLAALVLLSLSPQTTLAQPVLTNVGIDASQGFVLENGFVAFRASEARSGMDLNGDSDTSDFVLHIYDTQTGALTNTGLEANNIAVSGKYVAWTVFELAQGVTDLNGDSDASDFVLHVADMSTGTVTNFGLAATDPAIEGDTLGVRVLENRQDMTDLNGDGDASDGVLHLIDLPSGTVTNVGVDAAAGFVIDGGRVVFGARESNENNTDLNGDGDVSDIVLQAWDGVSVTNLGRASDLFGFELEGDLLAFLVVEASEGMGSLNNDADTLDKVVHIHDFSTGTTTNLELAVRGGADFQLAGGRVAMAVPESDQGGFDLNGDADANDEVLHIFDGSVVNLQFATEGFQLNSAYMAFSVRESSQGTTDLNSDGDTDDLILHLYETSAGGIQNLLTDASFGFELDGDMLLGFGASEANQGDGNGDGDTADFTLYVFDISSGNLTSLEIDPSGGLQTFQLDGKFVSFAVNEQAQNNTDFNDDGDANDNVLHYYDATTGSSTNLELDASFGHQLQNGVLAFIVDEASQGMQDLNGDGDALDIVLHVALLGGQLSAEDMLAKLIAHVESLGLHPRAGRRVEVMLRIAERMLERDRPRLSVRFLRLFQRFAHFRARRGIPGGDAKILIQEADDIIGVLREQHPDCTRGKGRHHR